MSVPVDGWSEALAAAGFRLVASTESRDVWLAPKARAVVEVARAGARAIVSGWSMPRVQIDWYGDAHDGAFSILARSQLREARGGDRPADIDALVDTVGEIAPLGFVFDRATLAGGTARVEFTNVGGLRGALCWIAGERRLELSIARSVSGDVVLERAWVDSQRLHGASALRTWMKQMVNGSRTAIERALTTARGGAT